MSDDEMNETIAAYDTARHYCCRCEQPSKLFKHRAFFCSEECADRVSDNTLDTGQQCVPNYLNDLNAIREAVLSAPLDGPTYLVNLWKVFGLERTSEFWTTANFANLMAVIHATARQRAEAFISTVCP